MTRRQKIIYTAVLVIWMSVTAIGWYIAVASNIDTQAMRGQEAQERDQKITEMLEAKQRACQTYIEAYCTSGAGASRTTSGDKP